MIRRRKNRIMPLNVSRELSNARGKQKRLVKAAGGPVLTQNEARAKLNLPPSAHGASFVRNLMAIRAEERLAIAAHVRKRPTVVQRFLGRLVTVYAIWKAVS